MVTFLSGLIELLLADQKLELQLLNLILHHLAGLLGGDAGTFGLYLRLFVVLHPLAEGFKSRLVEVDHR